jgi:hypothetical protein
LSTQLDTKNTTNPQAIWLSGFFIAQRSTTGFIDIPPFVAV